MIRDTKAGEWPELAILALGPFELRKWLDFVVVIFFKNVEKIASDGLITSLEKFGKKYLCM